MNIGTQRCSPWAAARREHVLVAGNVFAALKQHLRGTSCQDYVFNMKLRVERFDAVFIPLLI
ncbi:MAG: hypothetical protein P1P78_04945 [Methyloprofundus sp.]|nr:hypothetical protein [Methyloprofundus sp.]